GGGRAVRLWDAATGRELRPLPLPEGGARSVAFSPAGKSLVAGAWHWLACWDLAAARELRRQEEPRRSAVRLAFSPDGKRLASADLTADNSFSTIDLEGPAVTVRDAATGKPLHRLRSNGWDADGLAFSPDGRTLAAVNYDGVWLWEVATGTRRRQFKGRAG